MLSAPRALDQMTIACMYMCTILSYDYVQHIFICSLSLSLFVCYQRICKVRHLQTDGPIASRADMCVVVIMSILGCRSHYVPATSSKRLSNLCGGPMEMGTVSVSYLASKVKLVDDAMRILGIQMYGAVYSISIAKYEG